MIPLSAELKAHLAGATQTVCTLVYCARTDGEIFGFTDHESEIVFDSVTYTPAPSYARSDAAGGLDLNVDNLELRGMLSSPFITEDELRAGIWDFCFLRIVLVNYADLTMGAMVIRTGKLGEVSVERNQFKAELRGLAQAYTRTIGRLVVPGCDTTLGSARCGVDLAAWTVTGTVDSVSADNRTFNDADRTEPGPSAGISISAVSKANPGVVTLASPLGLPTGSIIVISGALGMPQINTVTVAGGISGSTFELPYDTTDFPTYTGGGKVRQLDSGSGYFDNGVVTFTTGANAGLSKEVLAYVLGSVTLVEPMPYPIAVGDEYSMHAGCDYSMATCRDRFDNIVNFRGYPYVPGLDRISQFGKET